MKSKQVICLCREQLLADVLANRQEALMRSYRELIKRIPLVKTLIERGEIESLEALYKNVCTSSLLCLD
jgi:hypothetical protein